MSFDGQLLTPRKSREQPFSLVLPYTHKSIGQNGPWLWKLQSTIVIAIITIVIITEHKTIILKVNSS